MTPFERIHGCLLGGACGDALVGGEDADSLAGFGGDDRLFGGDGDDRLVGGAGDDRINGGQGDDLVVGGSGDDIFVLLGAEADYTITRDGDVTMLTGDEGTDHLTGIEWLRFSDGIVANEDAVMLAVVPEPSLDLLPG